jgi:hypothetical protein
VTVEPELEIVDPMAKGGTIRSRLVKGSAAVVKETETDEIVSVGPKFDRMSCTVTSVDAAWLGVLNTMPTSKAATGARKNERLCIE